MPLNQNQIGEIGESIFKTRILHDGIIEQAFFLGEKAEAVDYMCSFMENNRSYTFFVQVKATTSGYNKINGNLKVAVNKATVDKLRMEMIPTYVAGIDILNEKIYLHGLFQQVNRIPSLPITYMLEIHNPNNINVINRLKNDVITYWNTHNHLHKQTYQSLMV